jgi:hypothetical protein
MNSIRVKPFFLPFIGLLNIERLIKTHQEIVSKRERTDGFVKSSPAKAGQGADKDCRGDS